MTIVQDLQTILDCMSAVNGTINYFNVKIFVEDIEDGTDSNELEVKAAFALVAKVIKATE